MAWHKGVKRGPKTPGSGRVAGTPNKRTVTIQDYAKSILEHPQVQARTLRQAKNGTLPSAIEQLLYYYAYGKPVERIAHGGDIEHPLQILLRRAPEALPSGDEPDDPEPSV